MNSHALLFKLTIPVVNLMFIGPCIIVMVEE